MSLRERLRVIFRLFLLFGVLIVIALLSAIATIRLIIHGRQESMPNLVGAQVEEAERITSRLGLELKVEDKLFSTQYASNEIVSQMPPPGTPLKVGQHVHVLVSLGPPRLHVPNLVGGSLRAARIIAIQRGLAVADVAAVHSTVARQEQVLVQDPPPAATEVRSPSVNLLVSLGGPPVAYLCPSFIGRPLAEARKTLEKAGFKVDPVVTIPAGSTQPGAILTQTPPPGSKIGPETVFSFQIAQ